MVKNEVEVAVSLLYSSRPPNHAQRTIEVTYFVNPVFPAAAPENKKENTNQILQLTRPHPIILVERMLIRYGLETRDFLLLGEDLLGCVVENGFHFAMLLPCHTISRHVMPCQKMGGYLNTYTAQQAWNAPWRGWLVWIFLYAVSLL